MSVLADAEHFARAPEWTWYILGYFFFAGLSGGSYVLASLLRFFGRSSDEPAVRVGYYASFVTFLVCPILLTLDLGQPLRFWHMVVNTTPGDTAPIFKYWSPMSVGAWALIIFGGFSALSAFDAYRRNRSAGQASPPGAIAKLWSAAGSVVGLFIAGYTGVLLSVSNQPVWSDSWALGGLFLASGLSGSAALMTWLARRRDPSAADGLAGSERYFAALELVLIAVFAVSLMGTGALDEAFGLPWAVLWLVALIGLVPGLRGLAPERLSVSPGGTVAVASARVGALAPGLVLLGVLALRAAVIFSVQ